LILVFVGLGQSLGSARAFKCTGHFSRVILGTTPASTNDFEFRAVIDGCSYRVVIFKKGHEYQSGHEEVAFDGQDSYRVHYGNTVPPSEIKPEEPISVNGWVTDPGIPSIGPTYMIYIWFPYLSSCYLASEPKGQVTCEFVTPSTFGKCRQPAEIHLNREDASLVDAMTIFHSGMQLEPDGKEHPLAPPFDKGFAQVVYRTTSVKKIGTALVPGEFEWSHYDPQLGGANSNAVTEISHIYGSIDTAEANIDGESIIPQLATRAAIFDPRITDQPYFATAFVQPREARHRHRVDQHLDSEPPEAKPALLTRRPALALFAVLLSVLAYFALFRRKPKN
jgi:hypothetical protein